MKTFVFDIDGTICTDTKGEYELAVPFKERIDFVNNLYRQGNRIKYFTARGSTTNIDWRELTSQQLKKWGALHHELILGKPFGDIYIDDKAFRLVIFDSRINITNSVIERMNVLYINIDEITKEITS